MRRQVDAQFLAATVRDQNNQAAAKGMYRQWFKILRFHGGTSAK